MAITVARTRLLTGSIWPDASTTGVPAGTSLTPVSGNFETSSNGEIVEDLDVSDGAIVVQHTDILVRRCRVTITPPGFTFFIVENAATDAGTTTVEDVELNGGGVGGPGGAGGACVVRRCNIHNTENAFHILPNTTIEDSYIHDLIWEEPAHADGAETSPDVANVTITGNNFDLIGAINAAIQFDSSATNPNSAWLVENNRLVLYDSGPNPGAFTIRLPTVDVSSDNVIVRNNLLGAGVFGYVETEAATAITEWSGNVDYLTGDPINLP